MKIPITVIIPTLNEERNLKRCLQSCQDFDETFLVDSNSVDQTKKIAKQFLPENHIINFKWNQKWPKKRYWAIKNLPIRNEWILLLDADEVITSKLAKEIEHKIQDVRYNGFLMPLSNSFMGKKLSFGDPSRKLALFRKNSGKYLKMNGNLSISRLDMEVHEHLSVKGKIGILKNKIIHNDFKDLKEYFDRHNRYSDWEAYLIYRDYYKKRHISVRSGLFGSLIDRRMFLKNILMSTPAKPIFYFIYAYIFKFGFLDGSTGCRFILCKCFYLMQIDLKVKELRNRGKD